MKEEDKAADDGDKAEEKSPEGESKPDETA